MKDQKVDKAVYILLYGNCKMVHNKKMIGPKMGLGYVFNEEALFAENKAALSSMTYKEDLVTLDESAFIRIDIPVFEGMIVQNDNKYKGGSKSLAEDQDLLWELFERHHFVKSTIRLEANLITEMPQLRDEALER